jgi:26S proteasome regulatory subunit N13
MSISPLITFKAGICSSDPPQGAPSPIKVKPQPEPGYIYLYSEDDLMHFCWRRRDQSLEEPELDLIIPPGDVSFKPYENASEPTAKTNGRIFAIKFFSSSQRYHFWLQSKPQSSDGNPSYFSPRDRKIGDIVHRLLQGDDVDITRELRGINRQQQPPRDDDDDDEMEDVDEQGASQGRSRSTGGAGPGATGGDIRDEGEESREGGSDGARA